MTTQSAGRRKLLLVIALFLLPLLGAALWHGLLPEDYKPASTANHGKLIEPVYPVRAFSLPTLEGSTFSNQNLGHVWTLVYLLDEACEATCSKALYNTRQIRLALGKDAERVKRITIANAAALAATDKRMWQPHPDMTLLLGGVGQGLDAQIRVQTAAQHYPPHSVYLIDPLGNLIMQFGPELEPKLILKDLQKLLRLSRIG